MIRAFEEMLQKVLVDGLGAAVNSVTFVPPDEVWASFCGGLPLGESHLNVHLVEIRENRTLRGSDGRTPARLDCHYLISAWTKADVPIATTTVFPFARNTDSSLLYSVASLLLQSQPLIPSEVWPAGPTLNEWNPYADNEVPMVMMPPDGFSKLPEFWGTQGMGARWRPVLHVIATLPIAAPPVVLAPPVRTILADVGGESLVLVGGTILQAGVAAVDAVVTLLLAGEKVRRVVTSDDGRFTFDRLTQGTYMLRAEKGSLSGQRVVNTAAPTSDWDISLS